MDDLTQFLSFIFLGVVQGLTEVLPISSSGHVALAQKLLALDTLTLASAAALHGGSLVAVALWFRRDLLALWHSFRGSWTLLKHPRQLFFSRANEYRVPYFIILSLAPVLIEAAYLENWANALFAEQITWVPILLLVNGLIILATAWFTRGEKRLDELTWKEYLLIGTVQGFAVLPGISRLGLTLCAGLWLGLNWYDAIRLTFILALPVIIGGVIWQMSDLMTQISSLNGLGLAIGIFTVFVMSLIGLRTLTTSLLERRTLDFFGYYCCLLGAFAATYVLVGFK